MPDSSDRSQTIDFSKAQYTAVISDLHLTEAEPPHPRLKLWKRFKSRDFFFDHIFSEWTKQISIKSNGEPIELVLNGDIFDFDSVMSLPEDPPYRISWREKRRGMHPGEEKSLFKIQKILSDHEVWVQALREFVLNGHRVVFVIGNHDLELHYPVVQNEILQALKLPESHAGRVQFCAFFYISNGDTLIEHGNQYDPYCVCQNPVNPMIQRFNRVEIRLPFGNLTARYLMNGMGFFNPHVASTWIMSLGEYVRFFVKYLIRAQPLIMWTWFWGSVISLYQAFNDRLTSDLKDPLTVEDRIEDISKKANATPRMVRELRELHIEPAASSPVLLAKELWLDRAGLVLIGFLGIFQMFTWVKLMFDISMYWAFIPLAILIPFFIFYSKSQQSSISQYMQPNERVLRIAGQITKTKRIVYGHTHEYRHEIIGGIEHLNAGCWSPAFLDVECTRPFGKRTYVWIHPGEGDKREATLFEYINNQSKLIFGKRRSFDREKKEALKVLPVASEDEAGS